MLGCSCVRVFIFMAKVTRFEDLRYWQASRRLVVHVYTVCKTGELSKDFDTKSQLKKAALSTMNNIDNIAEGFARFHRKDFARFLDYSQSSAADPRRISNKRQR